MDDALELDFVGGVIERADDRKRKGSLFLENVFRSSVHRQCVAGAYYRGFHLAENLGQNWACFVVCPREEGGPFQIQSLSS